MEIVGKRLSPSSRGLMIESNLHWFSAFNPFRGHLPLSLPNCRRCPLTNEITLDILYVSVSHHTVSFCPNSVNFLC
ncbi:hypothetical protein Hanom_Chr15g01352301 [Helianthus anomalus]